MSLAQQAGLLLRNVRLVEDLRASRRRLVSAQDHERRRLERNIHDGAQQQLVALAVKARLARQLTERDPPKAAEMLEQIEGETQTALEDLRDLARGIYPPLLADRAWSRPSRRRPGGRRSRSRSARTASGGSTGGRGRRVLQRAGVAPERGKYADASRVSVDLRADGVSSSSRWATTDGASTPRVDRVRHGPAGDRGPPGCAGRDRLEVESSPGGGTRVVGSLPAARSGHRGTRADGR
ncbi:MAG: histidine kinase dimerization/phosphoacceptor domain-containing protein [Actinomycetota bacterium]